MHLLDWTEELVRRFWDGLSETPLLEKFSFAKEAAPTIHALSRRFLDPDGSYLDVGGGDGHLARYLLQQGLRVSVYEPSKMRSLEVEELLSGESRYRGVVHQLAGGQYDGVFCLEVVEHILGSRLPAFLEGLAGSLRPGGILVLTCPNEEDLDANSVYCPVCEHYFHRWQHVRSVPHLDLLEWLEAAGFEKRWLGLIGLEVGPAIDDWVAAAEVRVEVERLTAEQAGVGAAPEGPIAGPVVGPAGSDENQEAAARPHSGALEIDPVDLRLGSEGNIVLVAQKRSIG